MPNPVYTRPDVNKRMVGTCTKSILSRFFREAQGWTNSALFASNCKEPRLVRPSPFFGYQRRMAERFHVWPFLLSSYPKNLYT